MMETSAAKSESGVAFGSTLGHFRRLLSATPIATLTTLARLIIAGLLPTVDATFSIARCCTLAVRQNFHEHIDTFYPWEVCNYNTEIDYGTNETFPSVIRSMGWVREYCRGTQYSSLEQWLVPLSTYISPYIGILLLCPVGDIAHYECKRKGWAMALKVLDRLRNPLQEYLRILGDPISAVFGAMSEIWSDAKTLSLIRGDDNIDGQLMLQQGALWISALAGDVRFTENTGWVPEIIQTLSAPHALDTQALEPKGTRNSQDTPAPQPVMQDGSRPGDKIDRAISTVITARKGFVSGVLIPVLLMLAVTAATFFDAYSKQGDKDTGLALAYCVWYSWILTLGVAGNCFASSLNTDVAERALDAVFDFGGKTMSTSLGDRYVNAYMWQAWVGSFDSGLSADGWDFQAARSRLASDWRFWLRLCGGQLLGFCCVAFSSACAVAIAWTTPTVGLGCRSFNFILFAIFSFITGYLNVLCSWLSILSEARASSSGRQRRAKILLRVVLGLYWVFVLANSLVVILGTLFHMVGVFRTCWCERLTWSDTTLIELNSKTAQAVDNAQSYWLSTAYVAFGLVWIACLTAIAFRTFIVKKMDSWIDGETARRMRRFRVRPVVSVVSN